MVDDVCPCIEEGFAACSRLLGVANESVDPVGGGAYTLNYFLNKYCEKSGPSGFAACELYKEL